jgi:hypothetical protein
MSRTAAAILASLVAIATSACGPAPAPPPLYSDVTFYWQFRDQDGNRYGDFTASFPGCDVANVDHVRVTLTDPLGTLPSMLVPCVAVNGMPGATFTALPTGPYTWFIEGLRSDFPVFAVQGAGDIVNSPFFYPTVEAVYPNMDLFYTLPPGVNCTGVAEIAFELDNIDGGVVEYSSENAFIACGPPFGFTMPSIPQGTYGYRFIEAIPSLGPPLYKACGVGLPPEPPLVQSPPNGSSFTIDLFPGDGTFCP